MSLKVAIFEDDQDVAELLVEMMELKNFQVKSFYNLAEVGWQQSDVILGDYRNKIVSFHTLDKECKKLNVPLIAISGAETEFTPQLIKPFAIEDLELIIFETINHHRNKKAEQAA